MNVALCGLGNRAGPVNKITEKQKKKNRARLAR